MWRTIVMMMVVMGAGAQELIRCWEYPTDRLGIDFEIVTEANRTVISKSLKVFRIYDRTHAEDGSYPIQVEYAIAGKPPARQTLYCSDELHGQKWCGAECDGGGFRLEANGTLAPEVMLLRRKEGEDAATGSDLILYPKEANITLIGHAIPCPSDLPKYYRDDPAGVHVCYDSIAYHQAYIGCYRSVQPCAQRHDRHFGTYPTLEASRKALQRCERSYPNDAYMDNPAGRYVCYENRDTKGFHGCFRTTRPCKSLNKHHFGHYTDTTQSEAALERCKRNAPRR